MSQRRSRSRSPNRRDVFNNLAEGGEATPGAEHGEITPAVGGELTGGASAEHGEITPAHAGGDASGGDVSVAGDFTPGADETVPHSAPIVPVAEEARGGESIGTMGEATPAGDTTMGMGTMGEATVPAEQHNETQENRKQMSPARSHKSQQLQSASRSKSRNVNVSPSPERPASQSAVSQSGDEEFDFDFDDAELDQFVTEVQAEEGAQLEDKKKADDVDLGEEEDLLKQIQVKMAELRQEGQKAAMEYDQLTQERENKKMMVGLVESQQLAQKMQQDKINKHYQLQDYPIPDTLGQATVSRDDLLRVTRIPASRRHRFLGTELNGTWTDTETLSQEQDLQDTMELFVTKPSKDCPRNAQGEVNPGQWLKPRAPWNWRMEVAPGDEKVRAIRGADAAESIVDQETVTGTATFTGNRVGRWTAEEISRVRREQFPEGGVFTRVRGADNNFHYVRVLEMVELSAEEKDDPKWYSVSDSFGQAWRVDEKIITIVGATVAEFPLCSVSQVVDPTFRYTAMKNSRDPLGQAGLKADKKDVQEHRAQWRHYAIFTQMQLDEINKLAGRPTSYQQSGTSLSSSSSALVEIEGKPAFAHDNRMKNTFGYLSMCIEASRKFQLDDEIIDEELNKAKESRQAASLSALYMQEEVHALKEQVAIEETQKETERPKIGSEEQKQQWVYRRQDFLELLKMDLQRALMRKQRAEEKVAQNKQHFEKRVEIFRIKAVNDRNLKLMDKLDHMLSLKEMAENIETEVEKQRKLRGLPGGAEAEEEEGEKELNPFKTKECAPVNMWDMDVKNPENLTALADKEARAKAAETAGGIGRAHKAEEAEDDVDALFGDDDEDDKKADEEVSAAQIAQQFTPEGSAASRSAQKVFASASAVKAPGLPGVKHLQKMREMLDIKQLYKNTKHKSKSPSRKREREEDDVEEGAGASASSQNSPPVMTLALVGDTSSRPKAEEEDLDKILVETMERRDRVKRARRDRAAKEAGKDGSPKLSPPRRKPNSGINVGTRGIQQDFDLEAWRKDRERRGITAR